MFKFLKVRLRFTVDLAYVVLLIVPYWIFRSKITEIGSEINELFIATYIFLGLGILIYFLVLDINPGLASIIHIGFLPFSSFIFLFTKWMPGVTTQMKTENTFFMAILAYLLLLLTYFNIQLLIHGRKPQEARKFRSVGG